MADVKSGITKPTRTTCTTRGYENLWLTVPGIQVRLEEVEHQRTIVRLFAVRDAVFSEL